MKYENNCKLEIDLKYIFIFFNDSYSLLKIYKN